MRCKKNNPPLIKYQVIVEEQAKQDLEKCDMQSRSWEKILKFLEINACRIISKKQRSPDPLRDIWLLRIPLDGKGTKGGGRMLYQRQGEEILIKRIFKKGDVDFAQDKKRNIFLRAIYEIQQGFSAS